MSRSRSRSSTFGAMTPPPESRAQNAPRERHDIDAEFRQRLQDSITTIDIVTGQPRWATNAEMNPREPNRQTNAESQELCRRYRRGNEPEQHEAVILDRLRARPFEDRWERSSFSADEFWAEHDLWVADNEASSLEWSSTSSDGEGTSSKRHSVDEPIQEVPGDDSVPDLSGPSGSRVQPVGTTRPENPGQGRAKVRPTSYESDALEPQGSADVAER